MINPFERSQETQRIVNYLRELGKDSSVTYQELSKQAGIKLNPQSPKLTQARRILQRDHNAVWICVQPKIGVRRLNDVEIAERLQRWWFSGARNKLKRAGKEIDVCDTQQLNIDQMARFGVDCVQRELAFNALSRTMRNRMEKVARGTSNDLPTFNIIEWAINLMPVKKPDHVGK